MIPNMTRWNGPPLLPPLNFLNRFPLYFLHTFYSVSITRSNFSSPSKKKYLPNFPTQENPGIENFKPKKSFDHPCHLKSGVPPWVFFNTVLTWPLDSSLSALWLVSHADVLRGLSCVPPPLTSAKFLKVQSALIRSGSLLWLVYVFSAPISRYSSGAGTRDVRDEPPRTSAWEATLWLLWQ